MSDLRSVTVLGRQLERQKNNTYWVIRFWDSLQPRWVEYAVELSETEALLREEELQLQGYSHYEIDIVEKFRVRPSCSG